MKTKDKEKIIDALQPQKKFKVCYGEEVFYEKTILASSEEEATDKYYDGEIEFKEEDIVDCKILDNSFEIYEEE